MNQENADDCDCSNCPQCQAASQACVVLGAFTEGIERMIADGTFERMGREMALRQEQAFLDAMLARLRD